MLRLMSKTIATREPSEWFRSEESAVLYLRQQGMREDLSQETYEAALVAVDFHCEHGQNDALRFPVSAFWRLLATLDASEIYPEIAPQIENYSAADEWARECYAAELHRAWSVQKIGQAQGSTLPDEAMLRAQKTLRRALETRDSALFKRAVSALKKARPNPNQGALIIQEFSDAHRAFAEQALEEARKSDEVRLHGWQKLRGVVWGRFHETLCSGFTARQIAQIILEADQGFKYLPRPCGTFVTNLAKLAKKPGRGDEIDVLIGHLKELRKAHKKYRREPDLALRRALEDLKRISRSWVAETIQNSKVSEISRIDDQIARDVKATIEQAGLETFSRHFFETARTYIAEWAKQRNAENCAESLGEIEYELRRDDLRGLTPELKKVVQAAREYREQFGQSWPQHHVVTVLYERNYGHLHRLHEYILWRRFASVAKALNHWRADGSLDEDELIKAVTEFVRSGRPNEQEIAGLFHWENGSRA
jgi:hypothetical protein